MKKTTHHLIAEVPGRRSRIGMTIGIDLGDVWSQLNASRVGGGFFWPVLMGTGATAAGAAGIKRVSLGALLFLLVVATAWLGYRASHVSTPLPVPDAVHRRVLFDAIGIFVGIGFGARFLQFFAGTEGLASVRM